MKFLIPLFLLFSSDLLAQVTDSSSFRTDSITVIVLRDSTKLIGYVINENDSTLVFAIYYSGPQMIDKRMILSRENKLKSEVDLSASTVVQQREKSKSPFLLPAPIIAAVDPAGLQSAELLQASNHIDSRLLLKKAHRIWITGTSDTSIVIPRKSFLYNTTANKVVITNAKDTARNLITIPVSRINTIATRKYKSAASWTYECFDLLGTEMSAGSIIVGAVVFIVTIPIMIIVSVCESKKKHYQINGDVVSYCRIRASLNKRAIVR